MSVAASIPCIRLATSSSSSCCSTSSTILRLSHTKTGVSMSFTTIRSSQAEGPMRRPVAPSPAPPTPPLQSPSPPSVAPASPSPPPKAATMVEDKSGITLEFQRAKARELQDYFKQKKLEAAAQGPVFGWVGKNEISNGRWAMFGFAVGLLTEYATGSDFVDQVKLILSNLGIVDLE